MRIRNVKGSITKNTGGTHYIYAPNGDIVYNADGFINLTAENEHIYTTEVKEMPPSKIEQDKVVFYETDGHYSTVYLVCLMLGMKDADAEELAIATEDPDPDIHSTTDFEIDETWSDGDDQENIHSLTGAFHGEEELLTALKFIKLGEVDGNHEKTIKRMGELLHRFGDTYAHTKFDNLLPENLMSYKLSENTKNDEEPENAKKARKEWQNERGEMLSDKIPNWILFINFNLDKYGYGFFTNLLQQREAFQGRTFSQYLREIYLLKSSDKFILYGGEKKSILGISTGVTGDHFETDGGYPDLIYMRPEWYLNYVKNLAWILSYRFKLNLKKLDISIFEKMVKFATKNKCSMKGIIDFEIAKKRNKSEVFIPVFYSKINRGFASIDAVYNTDYLDTAKTVLKNTKTYLKESQVSILNEGDETHYGHVKIHVQKGGSWYNYDDYEEYAQDYFVIKFKL